MLLWSLMLMILTSLTIPIEASERNAASLMMDSAELLPLPEAQGRGFFHKLFRKASTMTLTTNTTITKYLTCTSAEPKDTPTCAYYGRALPAVLRGGRMASTLYSENTHSEQLDRVTDTFLQSSFNSREELREDRLLQPAGRFLLTIHHSNLYAKTHTNTVTQIDYASTISVIYRGCIPHDAIKGPICGTPIYPPCYYGYHGHQNYFSYNCNPNAYLYQGPHGYFCPPGGFCGPDPTPTHLLGTYAVEVLSTSALVPSPVIQALRHVNLPDERLNGTEPIPVLDKMANSNTALGTSVNYSTVMESSILEPSLTAIDPSRVLSLGDDHTKSQIDKIGDDLQ